jgi:hypothetical protein
LGLFCAAFLPLLTFQKIVWVEPVISSIDTTNFEVISANSITNLPLPVEENFLISWEMVVGLLYVIGVLIFLTQLFVEFYSLRKIIKRKNKIKVDGFELIEVEEAISPFSFFNKIVYNRNLFQPEELHNIIEHEKIHAKQLHSLDVLTARIYCILFWWNPVVWFYKKAIVQNLEFIADHNALAKAKDKKSYLLTLLKITTAEKHVAITNHFYQSLIKKRIVMLHTNQSKKYHVWNYFIVLPALIFFMLTYQVEVVAQEKKIITDSENQKLSLIELEIEAQTTDKELKEASVLFNQEFSITLEYSKLKRNKKGDIIAIKVALKDKNSKSDIKTVYEVLGNTPIKSFKVFVGADPNGKVEFGYGEPKFYKNLANFVVNSNGSIDNTNDSIYVSKVSEEPIMISTSTTYSIHINADYSDKVFENYKKNLKKEYDIYLKLNSISRNTENKINGIDITLSNKKGISKSFVISEGEPIKPFDVFVKTDDKQEQNFGFSASLDNTHMKLHLEAVERSKNISKSKQFVLSMEEKNGKYVLKSAPESDVLVEEFSLEDNGAFLKNSLTILDGKIISTEDLEKIDVNSIKSVTVVKRAINDIAKYEQLFKKHGELAENGIIEIKTDGFQEPTEKEKIIITEFNNLILKKNEIQNKNKSDQSDKEQARATRKETFKERQNSFDKRKKMVDERKKLVDERKKIREKAIEEIRNEN